MTKTGDATDPDKYIYSSYGLGFDSTGEFTHPQGGTARNIIIFGADLSNSVHTTNQTQNILILGHGLNQKVNNTTIYAEKMYQPNFSAENKTFCLSIHYNGDNSYLFVDGKEVTKFKVKDFKNKANQLALGSISTSDIEVTSKILNCMEMFMTLVLTIVLFQMIKYIVFMLI